MRARRTLVAAASALVVLGTVTAPVADVAAAAPTSTVTRATARSDSTSTRSVVPAVDHRIVTRTQVRRAGADGSSTATLRAVTAAVHRSKFTADVPTSAYTLTGLRVSGAWARVTLRPTNPDELDPATVLLQKARGTWEVVDLGTAGVGCDIAPAATLTALKLDCS